MTQTPPDPGSPPLQRRDWIAGLEKGLDVMSCFDADHSRLNASEVAQRCGFATLSHFNAEFRRRTGTTPRAYRQG